MPEAKECKDCKNKDCESHFDWQPPLGPPCYVPSDGVKDRFIPNDDYNKCYGCKALSKAKDHQYPCYYCEENEANADRE